jgi:hypothetical protein
VFAVALLLGTLAYGQTTGGTILGDVSDDSGARVPGVAVTVRNTQTGITRSVTTDAAGRYRAPNLDPGLYEVRAELMGFRTAVRQGIQVTVAAELDVDLTLSVGAVTEQVVVTSEAPLVETTSAALSGLVDDKKIRDLPLNGRSFEQLAFLQPGVTPFYRGRHETDQGEGTKFSVSGSRVDSNGFLLDGMGVYDQSNMTPGSAAGVMLGVETVREFRVLTGNYGADYGRYSGGVITATTKSGTNQFHGNVFAFHRNDNLDARNFFDYLEDSRLPEFKRNQFGGTLGGPIIRDRTFFFGGYEGLRHRKGLSGVAVVPDANVHAGCLAGSGAQGNCPAGFRSVGVDPRIKPYLDLYPLPNEGVDPNPLDGVGRYFSSPTEPLREDFFSVRGDHQFSESDFLFGRYQFSDGMRSTPDEYPDVTVDSVTRSQVVTLDYKRIFSPTILNDVRAGLSRAYSNQFNQPLFDVTGKEFFPGRGVGLISFRSPAITLFGGGEGYPRRIGHNVWQLLDDATISRGGHAIKFGFVYERTQSNANFSRVFPGQYYFQSTGSGASAVSGLENFLRARPFEFTGDLPGTDNIRGWRQNFFGFYIQDDIQVRSNLTLNLGLRYEFTTVPTEANGKLSNFRNWLTDTEPTLGEPFFKAKYKDFGPRVGLAWDPFSNGKTSIRAGFGMFFDHLIATPLNRAITRIPPYSVTTRLQSTSGVPFPQLDESLLTSPSPSSIVSYALQYQMQDPTKIGYSFSIQRELGRQMMVNAAYAGSHSYHQLTGNNSNNAFPSEIINGQKYFCSVRSTVAFPCPDPRGAFRLPRRNPNIGQLQFGISPDGSSTYHSLQLGLNRRFSAGFQAQLSYTYAKYINDSDAVFGRAIDTAGTVRQDPDSLAGERSLASFDIRNYFSSNFTYDLPFARNLDGVAGKVLSGWQINGILSLANGTPNNIFTGFNNAQDGSSGNQVADRPNLLPEFVGKDLTEGSSAGCAGFDAGPVGTPNRYFDICAFVLPQAGFYGNLGRNTLIGPGLATFDFALTKNTSLTEGTSLQFRAEFFNLFNRANFSRPGPTQGGIRALETSGARVGSSTQINSTLTDARQIQLGLKLTF